MSFRSARSGASPGATARPPQNGSTNRRYGVWAPERHEVRHLPALATGPLQGRRQGGGLRVGPGLARRDFSRQHVHPGSLDCLQNLLDISSTVHDGNDGDRIARRIVDHQVGKHAPELHRAVGQVLSGVPNASTLSWATNAPIVSTWSRASCSRSSGAGGHRPSPSGRRAGHRLGPAPSRARSTR